MDLVMGRNGGIGESREVGGETFFFFRPMFATAQAH